MAPVTTLSPTGSQEVMYTVPQSSGYTGYDAAPPIAYTGYPGADQTNAQLAAFIRQRGRGRRFPQPTKRPFCRTCYDSDKGKSVYLSHNATDTRCPIRIQLSTIEDLPQEVTNTEWADTLAIEQVGYKSNIKPIDVPGLNSIQPVPAQLLSLEDSNGRPIHIVRFSRDNKFYY